jgi:hypothetical protein
MSASYAADDLDAFKVDVFRDSPIWDDNVRWFMRPIHVLHELFICSYECRTVGYPTEESSSIKHIRTLHPDCVLVY